MVKAVPFIVLALVHVLHAQQCREYPVFSIELTNAKRTLLSCRPGEGVSSTLSGPVLMADGAVLFYSRFGYLLFDRSGALLDSHSVYVPGDEEPSGKLELLYPVDRSTILYALNGEKGNPEKLYRKTLYRHRMKKAGDITVPPHIESQPLNIASNAITDEMRRRLFAKPQLIGWDDTESRRWWCLDKECTFNSPCVVEHDRSLETFFTGIKKKYRNNRSFQTPDYLGSCFIQEQWAFYGIRSSAGILPGSYSQYIYKCDNAGNVLRTDTIMKMIVKQAPPVSCDSNVNCSGDVNSLCFQPVIDDSGSIWYGIIDYRKPAIKVFRRVYENFETRQTEFSHMTTEILNRNALISYAAAQPVDHLRRPSMPCIPEAYIDEGGRIKRRLYARDLQKGGYMVRIYRRPAKDLARKVGQFMAELPETVRQIQDSISTLPTLEYPYTLSISYHNHGVLCTFDYGPGDNIAGARVIGVRGRDVMVRVDLEDRAELLIFSEKGVFAGRFVFNRQHVDRRRDCIAVNEGRIFERDYELSKITPHRLQWVAVFPGAIQQQASR